MGQTAQVEPLLSIEDLEKMPDDCMHRELVEGELIELPPPELIHALISRRIYDLLNAFVKAHKLGIVLFELGNLVASNRRTWIQPDVSFLRAGRFDANKPAKYAKGAPDLAVEVISPSERARDINRKSEFLLSHGSQEVWHVYSDTRTVHVATPGKPVTILRGGDEISSPLFPGWSVAVSRFFEDSD